MELESLRTFIAAVRAGSLTAASRRLHRSQPAITIQIQALEREAQTALLVRGPRGVRPTPAGELLYARARGLLQEAESLVDDLRSVGALRRGRLRVGATDVMATGLLPKVLARFRRRYPGIQVSVSVEGSRGLGAAVVAGDLDLALVTLPLEHPDLVIGEIHRERIYFVAAPDHHLRGGRLTLAQLAGEPMIHHRAGSVTREEVGAVFRLHGFEPRVAMEVSSPEAIKALVALGLGIAPLSQSQIAGELGEGRLRRLRVPEFRCWRRSGLIRRRDAVSLRAIEAFGAMMPLRRGRRDKR